MLKMLKVGKVVTMMCGALEQVQIPADVGRGGLPLAAIGLPSARSAPASSTPFVRMKTWKSL